MSENTSKKALKQTPKPTQTPQVHHAHLSLQEIENSVYGENGILSKIAIKIDQIGGRKAAEQLGLSTQSVYNLKKGIKENNRKLKLATVFDYAKKLGV